MRTPFCRIADDPRYLFQWNREYVRISENKPKRGGQDTTLTDESIVGHPSIEDMDSERGGTHQRMLAHVLVPVANKTDAAATAQSLEPYDPDHVTALHVIEKGGGVPDKTPVEQSEELAAEAFTAVRAVFPDADTHTAYERDIVEAIFTAADDVDASAIAYRSRGGGRLMQFITGDLSLKLVTQATHPVIALPRNQTDT